MDEAGCGEFMFALLFGLTTAARRVTGENVYSVFSLLSNRYARASSSFEILRERGRPFRCRRAAVLKKNFEAIALPGTRISWQPSIIPA